jgi:hypothetical protein
MERGCDSMRNKKIIIFIFFWVTFWIGIVLGGIIQKEFGIGNVLRSIGVPYPTALPPPSGLPPFEIPLPYPGQMSLFILAGQSNMVGWAPVPDNEETDPRVYMFANNYQWQMAREPVDNAYNQVDLVSQDNIAGFGPSLAFALASLEHNPDLVIGLIPCAKNSSGIIEWQRSLSDQTLYGSCLKRALAASPMGRFSGLLFFQGETDALDPGLYPQPEPQPTTWSDLFTSFVTGMRNDLGQPDLPVVFAQLGAHPMSFDFPNWEVVKEQQASVTLPMTAMIVTDDLPLMDGLHFTTESYRTIGKRFADAYWRLAADRDQE